MLTIWKLRIGPEPLSSIAQIAHAADLPAEIWNDRQR